MPAAEAGHPPHHAPGPGPARTARGSGLLRAVVLFVQGVLIGLANIIPGVSGGTMALILGIYERLIRAVGKFGPGFARDCVRSARRGWQGLLELAVRYEVPFLLLIACGALAALEGTSRLVPHLLETAPEPTYGFFFGLVAASIVTPLTLMERRGPRELAAALLGLAVALGVSAYSTHRVRLEAEARAALAPREEEAHLTEVSSKPHGTATASPPPQSGLGQAGFYTVAGALAISAMILPGISGSLVLLSLGAYFEVLAAIERRDWSVLLPFALGCAAGLLLFVRLLNWLFARWRAPTLGFLVGLMAGSLWQIWPFKEVETVAGKTFRLGNLWPAAFGGREAVALLSMLAGALIAGAFAAFEYRTRRRSGA